MCILLAFCAHALQGNGTIFLGGPPLVRAATGAVVTAEELGGAALHCTTSGGWAGSLCRSVLTCPRSVRQLWAASAACFVLCACWCACTWCVLFLMTCGHVLQQQLCAAGTAPLPLLLGPLAGALLSSFCTADVAAGVAGVTDHFAQDERHALAITRNIFASLNIKRQMGDGSGSTHSSVSQQRGYAPPVADWDEPMYDPCELRGAVPPDSRTPWDVRAVLGRILDGSRFEEFKSNYGKTLVTGGTGCRMWPLSAATTK